MNAMIQGMMLVAELIHIDDIPGEQMAKPVMAGLVFLIKEAKGTKNPSILKYFLLNIHNFHPGVIHEKLENAIRHQLADHPGASADAA
jgi:hypothetical protein